MDEIVKPTGMYSRRLPGGMLEWRHGLTDKKKENRLTVKFTSINTNYAFL